MVFILARIEVENRNEGTLDVLKVISTVPTSS
jgi:hypothetical protein